MKEIEVQPSLELSQAVLCPTEAHLYPSSLEECPRCYREGGTMLTKLLGWPMAGWPSGTKIAELKIAKKGLAK